MITPYAGAFLQLSIWELVLHASLLSQIVLAVLLVASILSWTIIFAKWSQFRGAEAANNAFIKAFRKSQSLEMAAMASQQFRQAPLTGVFDFGHEEVGRQLAAKGCLASAVALERSLQLGTSEELAKLERNMSWLATTATVSPFIGLFGTVLGIIDAFTGLGMAGSASLRAVAPGIAEALIATAAGLGAAIPAAIAYNQFGHRIRELGARMEDFALEFLNLAERTFER